MPPVVVYETPDGWLLADGHHRLAAARERGETAIDVELRRGSRLEALRCAASRAAQQRGISIEDAMTRILARARSRGDAS
jgi:ParB-like chromosome segregation protein Spo0J